MNLPNYIQASEIREQFAAAMSQMYQNEVPMYSKLLEMVSDINLQILETKSGFIQPLKNTDKLDYLSNERHGAIRLGKAEELYTMRRLFAVMGMYPVSYYDLTEAGIPVHSTAFRPVQLMHLEQNPFRMFTSLLRLDLIDDADLRAQAKALLDKRNIFSDGVIEMIERFEQQHGLTSEQAENFIQQALETFRWHQQAMVDRQTYGNFLKTHRLVADIVCFRGPHINHLTPRTMNIDRVQSQMKEYGLDAKTIIEGPPRRQYPILLRQTSFKALSEAVEFLGDGDEPEKGSHSARFGEVEQRGIALTPKGRKLYDKLLNQVRQQISDIDDRVEEYYRHLEQVFYEFPDDIDDLRMQGLAYFSYQARPGIKFPDDANLEQLIEIGAIRYLQMTYEDFLPVSAAGIFKSNLDDRNAQVFECSPNQQQFEQALGCPVISEFEVYQRIQTDSLNYALKQLGFADTQREALIQQLPGE